MRPEDLSDGGIDEFGDRNPSSDPFARLFPPDAFPARIARPVIAFEEDQFPHPGSSRRNSAGGEQPRGAEEEPLCFAAGTQILLADGATKAIEKIEIGQLVLACPHDELQADPTPCRVMAGLPQSTGRRSHAVSIAVADYVGARQSSGQRRCIPFDVPSRGWVAAGDLRPGDVLKTDSGIRAKVRGVKDTGEAAGTVARGKQSTFILWLFLA